jgi:DNA-binding response OmpR family regulator
MRVLLVEDESGIAQFIIQGLMEAGHTVELIRVCRIKAEPLSDKLFSHFEHD